MVEKGFFNRIKETLFGEETPEIEQEEKETEQILKEEEDILEQIEHDAETGVAHQQETKPLEAEVTEIEEAKAEIQSPEQEKSVPAGIQKVSKEEMEAKPENKPLIETLKTIEDPELGIDI